MMQRALLMAAPWLWLALCAATPRGVAPGTAHATPEDHAPVLPGSWSPAQIQPILDKTLVVRLAPSLASLGPGERAAVGDLLQAGRILQNLYEDMNHAQAARSPPRSRARTHPPRTRSPISTA